MAFPASARMISASEVWWRKPLYLGQEPWCPVDFVFFPNKNPCIERNTLLLFTKFQAIGLVSYSLIHMCHGQQLDLNYE